jgi:hypothetical protein
MERQATAEEIRQVQEQLAQTANDPDATIVTVHAFSLRKGSIGDDKLIKIVEKDLIDFHKSHRTGFYTFEPFTSTFISDFNRFWMNYRPCYDVRDTNCSFYLKPKKQLELITASIDYVSKDGGIAITYYQIWPDCIIADYDDFTEKRIYNKY